MVCVKVVCQRWCVKEGTVCQRWCGERWCVASCGCACHAKRRRMSPSATPATRNDGGCHQVPRLPRETKVDVDKCHACHAKCRGVTGVCQRGCVTKLCVKVVGDKVVGDKAVCERGRGGGGRGGGGGIQNQKQEPHAKMWGKTKSQNRIKSYQ